MAKKDTLKKEKHYGIEAFDADAVKTGLPILRAYDQVERIPTGSLSFDWVLGGGWPRGRISLIAGESQHGKTTIALLSAMYVTKHSEIMVNGGRVLFIDTENTYDPMWSYKLGIDPDKIRVIAPNDGEQALDAVIKAIEYRAFDLIIYDSIAETGFRAELEGTMEDQHVGLAARRFGQFVRKVKQPLALSSTALVMINQWRQKVGVVYGSPDVLYGGKALGGQVPFAPVVCVNMLRPEHEDEVMVLRPKTFKNKTAESRREGSVRVLRKSTQPFVDYVYEIVEVGKELGVFTREDGTKISGNGSWWFRGEKIGSSRNEVLSFLYSTEGKDKRLETLAAVRDAIQSLNRPLPAEALPAPLETSAPDDEGDDESPLPADVAEFLESAT